MTLPRAYTRNRHICSVKDCGHGAVASLRIDAKDWYAREHLKGTVHLCANHRGYLGVDGWLETLLRDKMAVPA